MNNTILKNTKIYKSNMGEIQIIETSRGFEFWSYNHDRNKNLHIGTLKGATLEKGNVRILYKPEPSITLSQAEYAAARDLGAQYLRVVTRDRRTYSISLEDFDRYKEGYHNPWYGPQWRVPLSRFARSARKRTRNAIVDNPRVGRGSGYERPKARQIGFDDFMGRREN